MTLAKFGAPSQRALQVAVAAAITVAFLAVGSVTGVAVTGSDTDEQTTIDDRGDGTGRGHGYGRDKDSLDFPGRGHGYGRDKDSLDFPGRGHGKAKDSDS